MGQNISQNWQKDSVKHMTVTEQKKVDNRFLA